LATADSLFTYVVDKESDQAGAFAKGEPAAQWDEITGLLKELPAPSSADPAGRMAAALRNSDKVDPQVKPLLDGYGGAFLLNLEGRRPLRVRLAITEALSAAGIPVTLGQLGLDRADSAAVKAIAETAGEGSASERGSEAYRFYSTMIHLDGLGGKFGRTQNEGDLADRLMADPVYLALADKLKELPARTVVFFGDSQTDNRHWSSPAHYPRIIEEVFRRINPGVKVFNAGIGGDDSGEGLKRIETDVLAHGPDICFILFGGNDCAFWGRDDSTVSPDQYEKNIEEIIQHLRAVECQPVLISYPSIPDPEFGEKSAAVLAEMNRRQELLRDKYATGWIDLAPVFAGRDPGRMFAVDLIHYSPEAHQVLAGMILQKLVEMN
jgi:lysophospholipase L1-like esterase